MDKKHIKGPVLDARKKSLIGELVLYVWTFNRAHERPLPNDRMCKHQIDRWSAPEAFKILDELCGVEAYEGMWFPDIPSIKTFGYVFGRDDILNLDIEWIGTDAANVIILYDKEAYVSMVKERNELLSSMSDIDD